jgi:hypothetical protein
MVEGELHGPAGATVCGLEELRKLSSDNRSTIETFWTGISKSDPTEALDANLGWDLSFGMNNCERYLNSFANTPVLGID